MQYLQFSNDASLAEYINTEFIRLRPKTGHSEKLVIEKEIGQGSNNAVYLARCEDGGSVVIRHPRSKSDSRRRDAAIKEFRHSAIAARLSVGPELLDAWYSRHSTKTQKAGLHMIMKHYENDLSHLLSDFKKLLQVKDSAADLIASHLRKLADNCILAIDLKPANVVYQLSPFDMRIIDFGCDYCESRPFNSDEVDEKSAVTAYIHKLARENSTGIDSETLYKDLLYVSMVILLSANMQYCASQKYCKKFQRCSAAELSKLNILADTAHRLRETSTGSFVKLVRKIMRFPDIRDVFAHYNGRRNSGTRRVFRFANFEK